MKQTIVSKLKFIATMTFLLAFIYLNLVFQDSLASPDNRQPLIGKQPAAALLTGRSDSQPAKTSEEYPADDDC